LIQGVGQAFTVSCLLALAADTLPKASFGIGIGYFSLGQTICQAIAPTVSLKLLGIVGYSKSYAVGAGIILCSILISSQIKLDFHRSKKFEVHLDQVLAKEAIFPAVLMFFLTMTASTVNSFLILFAETRGVTEISLYFTVSALTLLFTRPLVGKISDKYGFVKVAIPAFLFAVLNFFLIGHAHSLWGFLLAGFISAFGYGACQPAIQTLCMKSTPPERRGAASVTSFIGSDAAILVGPLVAGSVAEWQGGYTTAMWEIMTIPTIFALLLVIICSGKIKRIEDLFREAPDIAAHKS
jgi:MFS family permease